jgi:non-heme chloroperoxidase
MTRVIHPSAFEVRVATLASGLRLPYVEHGDPAGIPVVLLHGVTDSWRSFEPVLPHLPRSLRAIAVTQRGHGDADRPAAGYRFRDLAGDVAALLDALAIPRAVVVGHSMGAAVAQRFALDHPERVRGLVLAGSFASLAQHAGVREMCEATAQLADPVDPAFARDFQVSTLAQPVPDAFLEMVVGESLKLPARVWQSLFGAFADAANDHSGELKNVAAPTLLVWGDRDAYCSRADQDALLAAIAGSRLAVYAGAGHALHWEEPARFARDVAGFVASL